MSDVVSYALHGDIGVVTIDSPPVNALSHAVREGIVSCIAEGAADGGATALVLICAGRTFIAGADITEFDKPLKDPQLHDVIHALEDCPKPVVAAIHGTALGGGLETALGCHYRCAVASARMGFPEVHLGIIPGAGGTQRLPRLVGSEKALEMITSGVPIKAAEALSTGLIDELLEEDLAEGAVALAKRIVSEGAARPRVRDKDDKVKGVPAELFDGARALVAKTRRGFEAPLAAVDAVQAATDLSFDEGIAREGEIFMKLLTSDQSLAQRHLFFAERQISKIPDIPKDTPVKTIKSAAVLGAGTMGGGIAMNFANAGIPVFLLDTSEEALERGRAVIEQNYRRSLSKGRITEDQFHQCLGLITPTVNVEDFKDVDIVVEAVFEEMDIKKEVFTKLDKVMNPGAILATNTSTLDINEIAAVTSRPESVIGLHFFSPANVMKLLEIVRAEKTDKEVVATAMALAKTIRKVGVLVGVCDGFVGNRMVGPYIREATFLLEEGALPEQVDGALEAWGMAMGPHAMSDLAGLDVGYRIRKRQAATRPADERYSAVHDKICDLDRLGQKTGAGVYAYDPETRKRMPDPVVEALVVAESKAVGITRRKVTDEEIIERCIYALVNEGARILEEGIALRSGDIDIIYLYGYGFPAYRGGPMCYADTVGLKKVYERVCAFHKEHGKFWEPAPLLKKLAEEGGAFSRL